jgi:hypothetical protein
MVDSLQLLLSTARRIERPAAKEIAEISSG